MTQQFPPGWDEKRVQDLIDFYDQQTEDEAIAEAEAAYEDADYAVMQVPVALVPKVRELIAAFNAKEG